MKDLITEARELCESATPGPWKGIERGNSVVSHGVVTIAYDGQPQQNICSGVSPKTNNAAFIARSRTLVPELCDALEKAEEQNKQLLHEVCKLACESVERDYALAKLEAEVMARLEGTP